MTNGIREWTRSLAEAQDMYGMMGHYFTENRHDGTHGGLIRCLFSPAQIDTCTPELLQAARRAADERRCPYTVHVAQSVVEFNEMVARHGRTPIAWMRDLGILGPGAILGHAIIVGGSSWTNFPPGDVAMLIGSLSLAGRGLG